MLNSIKKTLVRHLLFPLQERVKKHSTFSKFKALEKSQWLSSTELQALQQQNLHKFLKTVLAKSAYFQALFKQHNIAISDIKDAGDLARLPFMDKAIIREHSQAIATMPLSDLSVNRTGGSSGEPLVFYTGMDRTSHDIAARMRANRWFDVDIGNKELVLWGAPHELNSQDRVKQIRDTMFRSKLVSAFNMQVEEMPNLIAQINDYQPEMMFAYPSAVHNLAAYCEKYSVALELPKLKAIFVTSEMLFEDQRKLIEKVFKAPVVNEYGGRDGGFIARECSKGKFHINAEDIIVEIVDNKGEVVADGEQGEVVITHLQSHDFPFIRYKMGDIASKSYESCECGRALPVLKGLEGRINDLLVGMDGRKVHPNVANYIIRLNADIIQYKVKQLADKQLEVSIVANLNIDDAAKDILVSDFEKRLGNVGISVKQVDNIAPEKSGKRRYVISEVEQ